MENIKILVVDDHPIVRMGLAAMINTQPNMTVVAEAENGLKALELYRHHRPDVTLMDLRIPGLSGIDATIQIRKEFPEARIIVLTTYDGDEDVYRALQAGARSYLLKEMFHKELLKAINLVHAGQKHFPSAITARLAERIPRTELSSREIEVLKLILNGNSNKEIGSMLSITEKTVKFHVSSILSKLDAADRTQAVTIALQRGIIHLND
jgi:DNA-binding NarL/FixJ family response regulator